VGRTIGQRRTELLVVSTFVALAIVAVASPAPAALAPADEELAAAQELAGFVPASERYGCVIGTDLASDFESAPGTPEVGITCPATAGVERVRYFRFADTDTMDAVYTAFAGPAGTDPVQSEEGECPGEGPWDFGKGTAGRLACYYADDPSRAALLWTYEKENILAFAAMPAGNTDAVALRKWWTDDGGPLEVADRIQSVAVKPADQPPALKFLRAHVPAATRRTCSAIDPFDPDSDGGSLYDVRMWVAAGLACSAPQRGLDRVVYQVLDSRAVDGYFEAYSSIAQNQSPPAGSTAECPSTGTTKRPKGNKLHVVGEVACFYGQSADGTQFAEYAWTNRDLGIVAYALNRAGDVSALSDFYYSGSAGPR
jgi:hypothetical protein